MKLTIPKEVREVVRQLEENGHQAFVVGGCVRDLLLKREPKDWDVATSAKPEEIQKIFSKSFYENQFFTVTVLTESEDPSLKEIEVTTFRADIKYGDRRHPEEITYAKTIEEDLARRDFTVNAIAVGIKGKDTEIIDPYEGQKDLKKKEIRAVGDPEERFQEDALRMMRAVRFFASLGFKIEKNTREAILKQSSLLGEISKERIRDEFVQILESARAAEGVEELRELGMMNSIIPELVEGYGVTQNKHHIYTVWEHNVKTLQYAAEQGWSLEVRLGSLLHDVAKPRVKRGEGKDSTFYGHDAVGAKLTKEILSRLHFSKKDIEKISSLVRYHMFYYNVGEVTESSIRRLLRKVGRENMEDLLRVRMADRIGSGVPKAQPYRLRHFRYLLEKVSQDPISAGMLSVNGNDIMNLLGINPGPAIGRILDVLLGEVLEDPKKNDKEHLEKRVRELGQLPEKKLKELAELARKERDEVETKRDEMTKQKYWVS